MPNDDKDEDMWMDENDTEMRDIVQPKEKPAIKLLSIQVLYIRS